MCTNAKGKLWQEDWVMEKFTLVCRGGPFPIVNRQNAFVLPIACFKLFPRLIVTVKHPGKQWSKLSALSWKLGGQLLISNWRTGIASAAIMACALAISIGIVDQDCFSKHSVSKTDSWAASLPAVRAPTKWGIQSVAASEMWSLEKFINITFMVLNTSSLIVPVAKSSCSSAAE